MIGERTTLFVQRALELKRRAAEAAASAAAAASASPPRPRTLYSLTWLAALGGFLFGYDAGVTSAAIVLMRREYGLSSVWQELTVSAAIGAAALLAVVGGHLNDIIGRKSVVLLASVLFTSGSICVSCAADRYILLVGRLVIGSGIGLTSTTVPMYIAECAPASVRGRLVSVNVVMTALGQLAGNVIGGLLSFTADGWRYMVGLGALPSVAQFVAFLFMPESPRWLVSIGRMEAAKDVLVRLRATSAGIDEELESISASFAGGDRDDVKRLSQRTIFMDMVRTPSVRRALLLGCGLQAIQQLAGINTVIYYSTVIITMAGIQTVTTAIWWSAATSTVYFLFSLAGLYFVEKLGRRWLTLLSLLGAVFGLAWLGAGFQLVAQTTPPVDFNEGNLSTSGWQCSSYRTCHDCRKSWDCGFCYEYAERGGDRGSGGVGGLIYNGSCLPLDSDNPLVSAFGRCRNVSQQQQQHELQQQQGSGMRFSTDFCPTPYYWTPLVGLLLYLAFFAPGMGLMPWTINSEIYPLWARGTGNGVAAFTNWFINLIMSVTFLSMSESLSVHGTFWMYLAFSVAGLVALAIILPETRGKSLEEMHGLFAAPWLGRDGRLATGSSRSVPYQQMTDSEELTPNGDTAAAAAAAAAAPAAAPAEDDSAGNHDG